MESGVGLPYAPENWPKPGDIWSWKVGPRVGGRGTFKDRYLYPPKHLPGLDTEMTRRGNAFRSRLSLERYIRRAFPKADVRKFFASFTWTIPSTDGQVHSTLHLYTYVICYTQKSEYIQFPTGLFPLPFFMDVFWTSRTPVISYCLYFVSTIFELYESLFNILNEKLFSWHCDILFCLIGMSQKQCLVPVYSSDEDPMHENGFDNVVCKAGNDKCRSLMPPSDTKPLPAMPCNICCSEPSFCSDCCCILCCKSISLEHEGYSYVKCEAVVSEGYICGHVAHINCALRAYVAGTIGGSIGLDAEYYCRRCDARKDLVPHVSRFLEICQTVEYQGDVEKILNLGICILRGSRRDNAKELLNCIESTVIKLKCGTSLENLWNDDAPTIWSDFSDIGESKGNDTLQSLQDVTPIEPMPFNHEAEMHKLEEEIRDVLKGLRGAQESEYQIAEARLYAQKECLDDLYRQLEKEKSELSRCGSGTDADSLMTNVVKRLDQIRREVTKLKEMEEVAKGFGRTPRGILEEYFHLNIEE
ncbi:OBERON-like protein isoform X2 [Eutrema salsugineum]|nr:OBERON-like protein isoform X2 [Eutrema salsugineum]